KVLTGVFLVLIGLSLILQGVGMEFPEEAFGVGMIIALALQWAYDKYGAAWFARHLGVTPSAPVAPPAGRNVESVERAEPAEDTEPATDTAVRADQDVSPHTSEHAT
ncbi:MAG: hypothetical protein AAFP84_19435, partial [Actinomycetota bacterium]